MEKLEDKNVKKLINKKINGNELNRDNFAFFYYNLNTNKYYFYNKEKWFVAASTNKVLIAILSPTLQLLVISPFPASKSSALYTNPMFGFISLLFIFS